MTTSDFIVYQLLGCEELDIETMFGTITDNDLFFEALNDLKNNGFTEFDANSIWYRAMELGIYKAFGDDSDLLESFEIDANCLASSVSFIGDKDAIEDFDEKANEFERLTGFSVNY